jgi:hypothetical protein
MKITEMQLRQNVSQLLKEEVYGTIATVYHGSKQPPEEFLKVFEDESGKVGWKTGEGSGSMYGHGLYTVWMQSSHETFKGRYGNWIYKLKVNLYGFIIFDAVICKKVYGSIISPLEQLQRLGKKHLINDFDEKQKELLSKTPVEKVRSGFQALNASKLLAGAVNGIVFFGEADGPVVLVYDPNIVTPMAYAKLENAKMNVWKKWNPEEISHSRARAAQGGTYADPTRLQDDQKIFNVDGLFKFRDPQKFLKNLNKLDIYKKTKVIIDSRMSPDLLKHLSKDDSPDIRKAVARNLKTPPDVLKILATDKDAYVKSSVAANINTPMDLLEFLTKDKSLDVRYEIALNKNSNESILDILAKDKRVAIKEMVARHKNISEETLRQLANEKNSKINLSIAMNPKTPSDILQSFVHEGNQLLKSYIVFHKNADDDTLKILTYNVSPKIRDEAKRRLANRNVKETKLRKLISLIIS